MHLQKLCPRCLDDWLEDETHGQLVVEHCPSCGLNNVIRPAPLGADNPKGGMAPVRAADAIGR